jgi:SRSO17 transposase
MGEAKGYEAPLDEQPIQEFWQRVRFAFTRVESYRHAQSYVKGLLLDVERKNNWQLAEALGMDKPYRLQNFIRRGSWEEEQVLDTLLDFQGEQLGKANGDLILDETGLFKRGEHSAGVKPQYCGVTGQIDNCQVGVFLAYATTTQQVLLDRDLYLPEDWLADPARCREAGIPKGTLFLTKPQLAMKQLRRAFDHGFAPTWVLGDEVYGRDPALRSFLEAREQPYVLTCDRTTVVERKGKRQVAKLLAQKLPDKAWKPLLCGQGSKGSRWYEWAWVKLDGLVGSELRPGNGLKQCLMFRRPLGSKDPEEIRYYLVYAPLGTSLEAAVVGAGKRWAIEQCFETGKGELGLDQYEVRKYVAWYRHMTLVLVAYAWLVALQKEEENQEKEAREKWWKKNSEENVAGVHSQSLSSV